MNATTFEQERSRLFGIAYRMTGSVADAEDIVQDAWIRAAPVESVDNPAAWLTTVTSRLALDRLKAAQRRREQYVGPWLAEPILTDRDPAHIVELDESVTLGFLHVLERLGPVERAVFLLRDVFGLDYSEVATVVGRSEAACRQISHRARSRVRSAAPRCDLDAGRRRELLDAFLLAAATGDAGALEALLAADVVLVSDGGPEHHAARRPVLGRYRVARLVTNLAKRMQGELDMSLTEANGEPAVFVRTTAGQMLLIVVRLAGDLIGSINVVVNPAKLAAVMEAIDSSGPATAK